MNPAWKLCLAIALLASAPAAGRGGEADEAARLRVLLVLDTDDPMGATWGLDGENVRALLDAGLKRQRLDGRYTLDVRSGAAAAPDAILRYYEELKVEPNEALLLYYSGHGAYHHNKGHFLALTRGNLYRKDLLARMQRHGPRLVVLMTDCCSNFAGGAVAEEPPVKIVRPIRGDGKHRPPAKAEEPAGRVRAVVPHQRKAPADVRPDTVTLLRAQKAAREEPPGAVEKRYAGRLQPGRPKARAEEPPSAERAAVRNTVLTTAAGRVPLGDLLGQVDGAALRDLLYRPRGVVDVNGCRKGSLSHGTQPWGGSLFTIALVRLLGQPADALDRNGNRVVEWAEFFPRWQQETTRTGDVVGRGRIHQVPEAVRLGAD